MLRSLDFLSLGESHAIFVRVDVYLQAFISSLCIRSIIRQRLLRLCVMLCLFVAPCACLFVWLIESSRAAAVRRAYSVRLIEAGRCSLVDVSRYLAATDRYCIVFSTFFFRCTFPVVLLSVQGPFQTIRLLLLRSFMKHRTSPAAYIQ